MVMVMVMVMMMMMMMMMMENENGAGDGVEDELEGGVVDDDVEEDEGDNAEDEVEDDKVEDDDVAEDEVEDDDVKGRKMMMLRRTDPKTAAHTFCEPAQSNAQNSHFLRNFTSKMLYRAPDTTSALCEPAQSKCTWTCHRSHFMRKFTGKMPEPRLSTPIKHRRKPSVDVFCLK